MASDDPILTAFVLSWELRHLSQAEVEFKDQYVKLAAQCSKFAVDLLDQTRGSQVRFLLMPIMFLIVVCYFEMFSE